MPDPSILKNVDLKKYKNAIFFTSNFRIASTEEAIKNPRGITIFNKELDLVIPIQNSNILSEIVKNIREADRKGPEPFIDPTIILKTNSQLETIEKFVNKYFVSISRKEEEFYSVLSSKERTSALERYLNRICNRTKIGNLKRSDIVFSPSQINVEFSDYINTIQNQLQIFE